MLLMGLQNARRRARMADLISTSDRQPMGAEFDAEIA